MHLQRANSCHNHRGIGSKSRGTALDVEELLGAHVGAEARLGDNDVRCRKCSAIGNDRVVAMRNVCERAGMHKRGAAFQCLQQVRLYRVAQERGHGASDFQIFGSHRFSVDGFGNHNATEPRA